MALRQTGKGAQRIAAIGANNNMRTTRDAIVRSRFLARTPNVMLIDLMHSSRHIKAISTNLNASEITDLVRDDASSGDTIAHDLAKPLESIGVGQVGADVDAKIGSPKVATAVETLTENYDCVVIEAGFPSEWALATSVNVATGAVLFDGERALDALRQVVDHLRNLDCVEITALTGPRNGSIMPPLRP